MQGVVVPMHMLLSQLQGSLAPPGKERKGNERNTHSNPSDRALTAREEEKKKEDMYCLSPAEIEKKTERSHLAETV